MRELDKNIWKIIGRPTKKGTLKRLLDYVVMTLSCVFYAIGISLFQDPNNLAPGGVTGIAIILNRISGLETGTLLFLINIPILILGLWKFGFRFILSTIYCTVLSSALINYLAPIGALTNDKLLAALAGSVLVAGSMGMIFKSGATTGGTDIIIKVLRLRFPHIKTGNLFFMFDAAIVIASGIIFRDLEVALYAGIAVVVTSVVLDVVLYGRDGAKMIYIISDKCDQITDRLLQDLDIGVTHIQGQGAFSGKDKKVIMCVMKKATSPMAEQIVKEEDSDAFMIVTDATEIFGEGYKSYFTEKL